MSPPAMSPRIRAVNMGFTHICLNLDTGIIYRCETTIRRKVKSITDMDRKNVSAILFFPCESASCGIKNFRKNAPGRNSVPRKTDSMKE